MLAIPFYNMSTQYKELIKQTIFENFKNINWTLKCLNYVILTWKFLIIIQNDEIKENEKRLTV